METQLRAALALGCSYLALSGAAWAAEAPATAPGAPAAVQEVVVTAQFHQQRLQDTPLAITALSANVLEARGVTDIANIAASAPNVTLKPLGSAFGPSMGASIRGIGQFDFNPALEPGVGVYVDDVYYPTLTGADLDLLDLDRVEVLRGPQGTLTGRNSIGGAIRLISKLPGGVSGGFFEGGYGSANRVELRGAANVAISDTLSLRVSGTHKSQDGYVKQIDYGCAFPASGVAAHAPAGHCQVGLDGDVNYTGLKAALRYRPNDKLDVVLSVDYTRSDTRAAGEVLTYANLPYAAAPSTAAAPGLGLDSRFICGRYCNYRVNSQPAAAWIVPPAFAGVFPFSLFAGYPLSATSGSDRQVFQGDGASANVKYTINDAFNVQSITAYRQYDSAFGGDGDLSPANVGYGLNELHHHFFSQEARLNGELSNRLKFTAGGYYSDQKTVYFTQQDIRYAPTPLQFVGNDPIPASSAAGFLTAFWTPVDKLTVTTGVRYTTEKKDYTFHRTNFDGSANPILGSLNGQTGHYSGDHTDYRVSLDYRWAAGLMTYATVSTGFKGGGVSPRPFNVAQVRPFNQEHLTAYELGAKADAFDSRLRVNGSVFFNDYRDIQLTQLSCPQFGGPGPCALVANVGDAEMKGAELEATANPFGALSLNGSVSYLDFRYTRLDPATGLNKSDTAPYTPRWKGSFGVQYDAALPDNAGMLSPRLDLTYQGQVFTNSANAPTNRLAAYTTLNGNITWRNREGDLSAAVEVTNLTNAYYLTTSFDVSGAGAGTVNAQPGRPREVVFKVKKTF